MNNICIIPARGGSKRIPRKNIKDFLGKPIIAYAIEAAQNSGLFSEIMISTDDQEIADVATQYNAKVPFLRSSKNADDFATLSDVFEEVKTSYQSQGRIYDNYCVVLPTSPFLTSDLLKQGYETLINSSFDSIRPMIRFHYPIQRAQRMQDGKVSFMQPEHLKTRSQDLEPAFHDAGLFYFVKGEAPMVSDNKGGFEMDARYAQDIDTPEDWIYAELKHKLLFQ